MLDGQGSAGTSLFLSLYFVIIPSLFVLVAFFIISTVRLFPYWWRWVDEEDTLPQRQVEEREPSSATVSIYYHFDMVIMD